MRSLFETARRQGKKPHLFFQNLLTYNTAQAPATFAEAFQNWASHQPRPATRYLHQLSHQRLHVITLVATFPIWFSN
jgi:hypothetical protein